jgi:hypothetical protein
MPRNKPRLQLALYARPKYPGTYHYALFVSPKANGNTGTKYHVKNTLQQDISGQLAQPWRYEKTDIQDVKLEHRLLVRVVIAKVTSTDALEKGLEVVPIYQVNDMDQEKAKGFNCRTWVRTALEKLEEEGVVAGLGDWDSVQSQSVEYIKKKLKAGRWGAGWTGGTDVPMLDLLDDREVFE